MESHTALGSLCLQAMQASFPCFSDPPTTKPQLLLQASPAQTFREQETVLMQFMTVGSQNGLGPTPYFPIEKQYSLNNKRV